MKNQLPINRRMTVYLGKEAEEIRKQILAHTETDVRFKRSPMNFARYAILYTLRHDPSLKRKVA